ncbi:hypothetical protein J1N35_040988 [Gossypium stocksii]|uniref:Uncharacterized protein n=1 Tax=Gossypium stocksii TaxID=47602 RepID=A0A9D3UF09_9ROSI|nr:hypothetical protein J1N35_040988 [Gossypium stocksii]
MPEYPIESLSNLPEIFSCGTIKPDKLVARSIYAHMDKFDEDDSGSESDESYFCYDEWHNNKGQIWLNGASTNQWSDNNEYNMPEHLDKLPYDMYGSYDHKGKRSIRRNPYVSRINIHSSVIKPTKLTTKHPTFY